MNKNNKKLIQIDICYIINLFLQFYLYTQAIESYAVAFSFFFLFNNVKKKNQTRQQLRKQKNLIFLRKNYFSNFFS